MRPLIDTYIDHNTGETCLDLQGNDVGAFVVRGCKIPVCRHGNAHEQYHCNINRRANCEDSHEGVDAYTDVFVNEETMVEY
jgi:hypothetical protein